jgi:N-methylhydantoinase A
MLPQTSASAAGVTKQPARQAYFGDYGWLDTPVVSRADLRSGRDGPLIVEEYDATSLVPPGARAELDDAGNIVIAL